MADLEAALRRLHLLAAETAALIAAVDLEVEKLQDERDAAVARVGELVIERDELRERVRNLERQIRESK